MPGDRRDEDMQAYGALAAAAFDEVIVREDKNLRGRKPGETATLVVDGIRADRAATNGKAPSAAGLSGRSRVNRVDKILDEASAVRAALRRANPGDLVVMCVDDAIGVYRETMALGRSADSGGTAFADPGELEAPEG